MVAQWTALPPHTKKVVSSIKHVLAWYANAPPQPNSLFFLQMMWPPPHQIAPPLLLYEYVCRATYTED